VSRAQRSAAELLPFAYKSQPALRCRRGTATNYVLAVPDQRCTTRARWRTRAYLNSIPERALALHRIRDMQEADLVMIRQCFIHCY